jgi:hypothetical protein
VNEFLPKTFPAILLACLLIVSCAQRETSTGIDATGLRPAVADTFIIAKCTQDTTWHPRGSNGFGLSLELGRAGNFSAVSVLRFEPAAALPDSFRIDSNRLVLRGVTITPEGIDEQATASIRLITDTWSEDSVRVDNMPNCTTYVELTQAFMSSQATDSLEVRLPDTLVAKWISGDTLNWGVWIEQMRSAIPEDSGFLREFYSGESGLGYAPALYLYGVRYDSTDEGVWEETALDTFVGPADDAFLAWDTQPPIEDRTTLTQGLSQRLLLYFPLENVMPAYGASVIHAELSLWQDMLNEANFGSITLLKHGTLASKSWQNYPDSTVTDQVSIASSYFDSDGKIVFNATSVVSNWVQNPETNNGFFIVSSSEGQALGRLVFYNRLASDTTVVPELKIWYATIQ